MLIINECRSFDLL